MIQVGITGGTTRYAGELIRILINHPDVEIRRVYTENDTTEQVDNSWRWHSKENDATEHTYYVWETVHKNYVGTKIADYHKGLYGDTDLRFCDTCDFENIDVLFLCKDARVFMETHKNELPKELKIIDLTGDFRFEDGSHDFVYGLPELNRKKLVRGAIHAACPSRFATAISLTLLPLAKNLLLNSDLEIHLRHTYPDESLNGTEQEVRQALTSLQNSFNSNIIIVPVTDTLSGGIIAKTSIECSLTEEEVKYLYNNYYSDHNFTFVTDREVTLSDVLNTNKCLLNIEKTENIVVITSVIDDMIKGSAGTAVHIMNLLFGLSEKVGLQLKAYVH